MVSVAAAHDHTVVLCAASCPSLPHGASFTPVDAVSGAHVDGGPVDAEAEEGEEGDMDSEVGEEENKGDILAGHGGIFTTTSAGRFEPLTLKQICEAKLAQEVDLHNAGAMLAYAVGPLSFQFVVGNVTTEWLLVPVARQPRSNTSAALL